MTVNQTISPSHFKRRLRHFLFVLIPLAGCAQPVLVHTRQELVQHLGQKVAVEGVYEIGNNGEYVRSDDIEVGLDVNPDVFGFGRPPMTNGLPVRASGTVERGAMSMGIFTSSIPAGITASFAAIPLMSFGSTMAILYSPV